ncbi:feruloyl esterase [Pseudoduganella flava]|uniref:Feruloyl esterase n=1 Tax=Pseudoduganella flava TaxID=871742 RepID=A0A562PHV0_9BURK|nr:tannase/feruloyl esterase family alpha/beta hydrolase [Pseudoduganella flava]QGZ42843.1 tannase/feruloyl esterase family alpha/beta hydrolase [Pseudoduganella flava]TWI44052.1 feruloyl esterase [Pseudoduganella flava]
MQITLSRTALALAGVALLPGCGGDTVVAQGPRLAAASGAKLASCADLATRAPYAGMTITAATVAPAGSVTQTLNGASVPMPEHCVLQGRLNERTGSDGRPYAIGFEMRLPRDWNGRFFYQANGGNDGSITGGNAAFGNLPGGGATSNALAQGYAVISSDAGHVPDATRPPAIAGQVYGLDPQARLDYGYNAVAQLTPMAKHLIRAAYGKGPDRSYIAGCSNGGRHALVAASRYGDQYDGVLAGAPGYNLPKAAVAQMYDAQALAQAAPRGADGRPNIGAGFTDADLRLVANKVLERCDALDGLADGIVAATARCQQAFSLERDVPTCTGTADGTCLTAVQKGALAKVYAGAKNAAGTALYAAWPYDPGIAASGWRAWKLGSATAPGLTATLGAPSMAYIFSTPPADPAVLTGTGTTLLDYALRYSFETDAPKIHATTDVYRESAMAFMTPPNPGHLDTLRSRGGKVLVYHGVSDPVFSFDDTVAWLDALKANYADTPAFARLFAVPGMNHCSGGPATDQFEMLGALVDWVEKGIAPETIRATARPAAANPGIGTIPAGRTRPLCSWPKVATYAGGNVDDAASFICQ